jgi:hypothetical protein
MKRLSRIVPLISVALLLVLALLPASAPANPAAATISFAGGGTLRDDGTVDVTLHYSCLPPSPAAGGISASLDEGGTAAGGTAATPVCDGRNHSVTLNILGLPLGFSPGIAAGNASVTNDTGGSFAVTNEQVMIK